MCVSFLVAAYPITLFLLYSVFLFSFLSITGMDSLFCLHVESEAYVKGIFAKSIFRFLVYDWYVLFVVFMSSFFTYVVFLLHVYLVRKVEFLVGSHRFMTLLMNSLFFIFFQRWAFAYFLDSTNGCIMLMSIFTVLYHSPIIPFLVSHRNCSTRPSKLHNVVQGDLHKRRSVVMVADLFRVPFFTLERCDRAFRWNFICKLHPVPSSPETTTGSFSLHYHKLHHLLCEFV